MFDQHDLFFSKTIHLQTNFVLYKKLMIHSSLFSFELLFWRGSSSIPVILTYFRHQSRKRILNMSNVLYLIINVCFHLKFWFNKQNLFSKKRKKFTAGFSHQNSSANFLLDLVRKSPLLNRDLWHFSCQDRSGYFRRHPSSASLSICCFSSGWDGESLKEFDVVCV